MQLVRIVSWTQDTRCFHFTVLHYCFFFSPLFFSPRPAKFRPLLDHTYCLKRYSVSGSSSFLFQFQSAAFSEPPPPRHTHTHTHTPPHPSQSAILHCMRRHWNTGELPIQSRLMRESNVRSVSSTAIKIEHYFTRLNGFPNSTRNTKINKTLKVNDAPDSLQSEYLSLRVKCPRKRLRQEVI